MKRDLITTLLERRKNETYTYEQRPIYYDIKIGVIETYLGLRYIHMKRDLRTIFLERRINEANTYKKRPTY